MGLIRLESSLFILLAIFSVLTGLVFSKMNLSKSYKGVTVKGDGFSLIKMDLVLNKH